ncbi:MAG: hypothetical protein NC120_09880 [Ruminococcus sp.]|nr:hypothetical protein [Ruminococcus sp.]
MGDTLLYHLIFRIISFILIVTAVLTSLFSEFTAKCILVGAAGACVIWAVVNMIILLVRAIKGYDFWRQGLGLEPSIWALLIMVIGKLIV